MLLPVDKRDAQQPTDTRQRVATFAKAMIPEPRFTDLTEQLCRELEEYIEPETQRIGTGLIAPMGGNPTLAGPTVTDQLGPVRARRTARIVARTLRRRALARTWQDETSGVRMVEAIEKHDPT